MTWALVFTVGAYLVCGIPFGLIVAMAMGHVDVRTVGSGNIGTTNVARSVGKGAAGLTLLLDAAASYLRSEGGSSAYLFTDTSCSWSFYEERGLARAAAIKTPRHLRKFMCSAYYLYTLDLAD